MKQLAGILGLLQTDPEAYFRTAVKIEWSDTEVEARIVDRNKARANKDWAESDRIREELNSQGIILEDYAQGTRWRRGC
jgi:cysteinyl-tRNA synthetase